MILLFCQAQILCLTISLLMVLPTIFRCSGASTGMWSLIRKTFGFFKRGESVKVKMSNIDKATYELLKDLGAKSKQCGQSIWGTCKNVEQSVSWSNGHFCRLCIANYQHQYTEVTRLLASCPQRAFCYINLCVITQLCCPFFKHCKQG